MTSRTIHHYPAGGAVQTNYPIPPGSIIRSAAYRPTSGPVVYVEKDAEATGKTHTLKTFFVGTGYRFIPDDLDFIGTVSSGNGLFWHVYARISDNG